MVDLCDRQRVIAAPRKPAVKRKRRALVHPKEHPLAVGRINPDVVHVFTARSAFEGDESLAAVGRLIGGCAQGVEHVGILRIHPDAADVVPTADPRIVAGHVFPRGALVVGAEKSGSILLGRAD